MSDTVPCPPPFVPGPPQEPGEPFEWPVRCNCCGAVHSPDDWAGLPTVGAMGESIDDLMLYLRNCRCDTTLSVPLLDDINAEFGR